MEPSDIPRQMAYGQRMFDKLIPGVGLLLARALLYVLCLFVFCAIAWMTLTHAEVVVTARGRLMVQGEPVKLTVAEPALVTAIPVQIGSHVCVGDTLMQFGQLGHKSDSARLLAELASLSNAVEQCQAIAQTERTLADSLKTEIELAARSVAIVEEQARTFRKLADDKVFSDLESQQKEQELLDAKSKLARLRSELRQHEDLAAQSELAAFGARAKVCAGETQRTRSVELQQRMVLKAPIDGVVTHLLILHPGSMIPTDSPAVIITPDNKPLLASISIPNENIRRLQKGMPVRIGLDAYPHQDYGFLSGTLEQIEPEPDEKGMFRGWVALSRLSVQGSRGKETLRPGLALSAEIIIEKRSLMALLLKPLRQLHRPVTLTD